jgi:hypothetical protein
MAHGLPVVGVSSGDDEVGWGHRAEPEQQAGVAPLEEPEML